MFYIHLLAQPPSPEVNSSSSKPVEEREQRLRVQYYQVEVKKIHQRIQENYHLERRF